MEERTSRKRTNLPNKTKEDSDNSRMHGARRMMDSMSLKRLIKIKNMGFLIGLLMHGATLARRRRKKR